MRVTHSASVENNSMQEFFDAAEYLDDTGESSEVNNDLFTDYKLVKSTVSRVL